MKVAAFLLAGTVWLSASAQELHLEQVRTFTGHQFGIRKVIFSPDEKKFASGGTRGEIYVWDVATGSMLKDLKGHMGSVADLRFSTDGKLLVSGSDDGQVIVWDLATSKAIDKAFNPPDANGQVQVRFALITHDNSKVYFAGHDQRLFCRKMGGTTEVIYTDRTETMRCAQVSPNGSRLMVGAGKLLLLFDPATGKLIKEFNTGDCVINAIQYATDGSRLITWCENARVDMRDPETMNLRSSFSSGSGHRKFSNLAFTSDQRYIVTGDHAARFNVWDLQLRRMVLDQPTDQGTVLDFDISRSPTMLLSGSMDRSIKLWKIADGPLVVEKGKKRAEAPAQTIEVVTYDEPVAEAKPAVVPVVAPSPASTQPTPAPATPTKAPVDATPVPVTKTQVVQTPVATNEAKPATEAKKDEPKPVTSSSVEPSTVKEKPAQQPATTPAVTTKPVESKPADKPIVLKPTVPNNNVAAHAATAKPSTKPTQYESVMKHVAEVRDTTKGSEGRLISQLPERFIGRRVPPVRTDHKLYFLKPQITIAMWDAQVIDGDIISLYVNDQLLLTEHSLTEAKKNVQFDAAGYKRCYLFLHAHNLGKVPPSTVTMTITDGTKSYQIEVRSDLTMSSGVEINFE